MELTTEQVSWLERLSKRLAIKIAVWALGLVGVWIATAIPRSWPMRIALLLIVALALLSLWLCVRCLRLEKNMRTLRDEPPKEPQQAKSQDLNPRAFEILCWIHDEDGKVTVERIIERFKIGAPEVRMHLRRLWERCFISDVGESLDDPPGYRINPDGTEYVLKYRHQ
jgi:hypothetical protein